MALIETWNFDAGGVFDGSRMFAEARPDVPKSLRAATLEFAFRPAQLRRATVLAHGVPGRDPGAFTIVLTRAGAVSLTCTDGAATPYRFRTPDGFAAAEETVQVTIAASVAGGAFTVVNVTRRDRVPHDPGGGFRAPLPLKARLDLKGSHGFTVGAASGGVAPFFQGVMERATLSDSLDPPRVPLPTAEVHRLDLHRTGAVRPRRVALASPPGGITRQRRDLVRPGLRGMRIATSDGDKLLARLEPGDEVLTRDHGFQRVRWTGRVQLDWKTLAAAPHLRPVILRSGVLGPHTPDADLVLTQGQRILLAYADTADDETPPEALTPARRLLDPRGHPQVEAIGVSYIQFHCTQHEMVQVNGLWIEAFHPGRAAVGPGAEVRRQEILELFPDLRARVKPTRF